MTGKQHLETEKGLTMRANAFSDEKTITINFVKKNVIRVQIGNSESTV